MPVYDNSEYIKIMRPIPKGWKVDKYGIPYVKKSEIDISNLNNGKWLVSLSNASIDDKNSKKKIIQSFRYDNELYRFYNKPFRYLEIASKYYAVSTLDFSMHPGMSEAQIINATFENRWSGVWLQQNGVDKIAVTVGWVYEDTFDICFSGIEDGILLIISTLGVCNEFSENDFLKGYRELRNRFKKSPIICVGNKIDGMHDDVCFIEYKDTFGNWDKYRNYWQPAFLNWDLTEVDLCHLEDH